MTAGIDRQAQVLLTKATEDEAVILLPGIPEGPFGFHVQQAVEKLLKALLSKLSIEYKFTHDLNHLELQLKDAGEALPKALEDFSKIGTFAVTNRYDDIPEFHVLDHQAAIETVASSANTSSPASPRFPQPPSPPPLQ
jgi:hypothetical protein